MPMGDAVVIVEAYSQELSCSKRADGYFILLMIKLHLPHVKIVRFLVHNVDVVIPTPETAGTVGVLAVRHPCR